MFAKAPGFDKDNREDRFAFSFDRMTFVYAAGLRIARDPSAPWLYLGCILLLAGAGLALSSSHRRLWVRLVGGTLELAGDAQRNLASFEKEFLALSDALGLVATQRPASPKDPP